jgi:hypothetical protein
LEKEKGKIVPTENLLACSQELENLRERYLNGEFKSKSPFSMTSIYSPETERLHEEIRNCIERFSNEKEKN